MADKKEIEKKLKEKEDELDVKVQELNTLREERNNQRVGKACIPAKAIAATSNKLQLPSYDEGFDKLYFVKNNGSDMVIEDWR